MAKLWTFSTMAVGMLFLLRIMGIPTGVDWLLTFVGYSDGNIVNNSLFYTAVIALLALSTGASIIIGVFGRTAPEYAVLAPFATGSLIVFAATFVAIANYMSNFGEWLYYPVLGIMLVYGVGFLYATVAYVFGGDQ